MSYARNFPRRQLSGAPGQEESGRGRVGRLATGVSGEGEEEEEDQERADSLVAEVGDLGAHTALRYT